MNINIEPILFENSRLITDRLLEFVLWFSYILISTDNYNITLNNPSDYRTMNEIVYVSQNII